MDKLRIGVIGIGAFGLLHVKTIAAMESAVIEAISSRNYDRVKPIADQYTTRLYTEYRELLSDQKIDAVTICVPPDVQPEIAIAALDAGKHVLLEKPIATKLAAAKAVIDKADTSDRVAMVGYIERFNPSLRRVKDLIQYDHIGTPFKVSIRRSSCFKGKPEWVFEKVGMMLHIAGHNVDIVRWLMDDEVNNVYAAGGSYLRRRAGQPDNLVLVLQMKKGGLAVVEDSWTMPSTFPTEENDTRLDVLGTKGNLIVNNLIQTIIMVNEASGVAFPGILRWPGGMEEESSLSSYAMKDEIQHFIRCVRGEAMPLVSVEDATKTISVLLAANRSLKSQIPERPEVLT